MPEGAKFGGRVKGTPNKKTAEAISRAERILRLIENKYFEKDIAKLSSGKRMDLYSAMLEYVAPKLSRAEVHSKTDNKITLEIIRKGQVRAEGTSPGAAESH